MHVDLTFMEAVTLLTILLGGFFTILKFAYWQFAKNISQRFAEIEQNLKEQSDRTTASANSIMESTLDKIKIHQMEVELAAEKRHNLYTEKFYSSASADAFIARTEKMHSEIINKTEKITGEIFAMLREINDKFEKTVGREECSDNRRKEGR